MANKERGEIAVEFDGESINLILSTNAICELEDAADCSITDILDKVGEKDKRARFKFVRWLFWAMMLDARPNATVADAGKLIDSLRGKHDQVMVAAIIAAFPEANAGGDAPGK